ncbi:MAG: plasmid recombination protein [Flavobacteriaceae bacterium]|nr:plasmid recombination protein [Flavobacteriaceae bacterium]
MAKQYAIIHVQKHSSAGGGLGNHIERTPGKEHTYPHANSEMKKHNISFDTGYKNLSLGQAVQKRIEKGYTGKTAIRKDAVKFLSLILSGTHEQTIKIHKSAELFSAYINANKKFLEQEYGKENIVKLELHRDEKTPHFHAIVVPLTKEGQLSAKKIVGNRNDLKAFQDRYAAAMKPFGLERGEEESQNTHITTKEFYQELEKTRKEVQNLDLESIKLIPAAQKTEMIKNYAKTNLLDLNIENLKQEKNKGFKI